MNDGATLASGPTRINVRVVRDTSIRGVDTVWGLGLLATGSVTRLLRTSSLLMARRLLLVLVAGTAAFSRDFSKLGIKPLYITEACIVVFVVTLGTLLRQNRVALFPAGRLARWTIQLVIVYVLFGATRLAIDFASSGLGSALATLRNFAVVYYAAFAVIGWLALQRSGTQAAIRTLLAAMVLASTATSLWTVIAYIMGFEASSTDPTLDASVIIQGQAAAFAMLSVLILVNVLRYDVFGRRTLLRYAIVVILFLNIVYLYMSGHRSALVGCAAGAMTMMVGLKTRLASRIRWRWAALTLVLTAIVWHFLSAYLITISAKFQTLRAPMEELNAAWRAAFWLAVLALWWSAPILGVGFSHDFYDEDPLRLVEADHYDPHNSYLAIAARTGAVGLLLLMAASTLFARLMSRLVRTSRSKETVMLASCLLCCFVALGTFAAANVTLESPYHALFFWLFVGMGVALAESEEVNLRTSA